MNIKLSNYNQVFSSRAMAHTIFDEIDTKGEVVIDFDNVKEATPSFCHEMLEIVLNKKNLKLKILNTNSSIKFQLDKARASFSKS